MRVNFAQLCQSTNSVRFAAQIQFLYFNSWHNTISLLHPIHYFKRVNGLPLSRATTPESLSEEVHSSPSRISLSGNSQPVFEADRSEPSTPTALISTPTPLPTTVVEATPEKAVMKCIHII